MNREPRVGTPSTDFRAVCAYSATPGAPQCTERATWHLAITHPAGIDGVVGLATCDVHLEIAAAAGPVLGMHDHQTWCGLPGTLWRDAGCALDGTGHGAAS